MSAARTISLRPGRRVRVPTTLQQEAAECGAACLAMILAAHGRWITLAELRELCGVGRDGVKASNILRAARTLGLLAKGLQVEPEQLVELPAPFIVFWNLNHFVVVERFPRSRNGRVWINDPASGPRAVTRAEFDDAFTGVALSFETRPEFERKGHRETVFGLLRDRLRGYSRGLVMAIMAGLLVVVPSVVAAGFTRVFIDNVLIANDRDWLKPLIGTLLAIAALRGLLTYLQQMSLVRTQTALTTSAAAQQMWRILHLSLGFFTQRFAGDVANRFGLVDRLGGIVAGTLAPAVVALVSVGAYGGALVALNPTLGLVALGAAAAAVAVTVGAARILEDTGLRSVKEESRWQAATIQGIGIAEDIKANGTERLFMARWMGFHAKVVDAEQRSRKMSVVVGQASSLIMALATVAVLVIGGRQVMNGTTTIGVLLAFQTLFGSFSGPVLSLVGIGNQLQQVRGITERLDDIAFYRADGERAARESVAGVEAPVLDLQEVSFGYSPLEAPFIRGLSLTVRPGTRIALVGATGSGKSTIGRLMAGLVEPRGGTVSLGGVALFEWPTTRLRKTIAYLDQDASLFAGTIRDNIALWDASLSEDRIVAAARDVGAHEFVAARERGYDTLVAEGGGNLSGGERQRIALARAFAIAPNFMVLDEATSALDPPVEARVMNAVRRHGCACIVITHRLTTIRDSDLILLLENGAVVESGRHDELMVASPRYRELVQA